MPTGFTIVGLGEALFDIFPDKQVLGGSPLNVAVHAHQLSQPIGGHGVVVSRIGQNALGQQLLDELRKRGMSTEFVQTDPDRDTGKVYVSLDAHGEPKFEIVNQVAWDWLQFDPDMETLAAHCDAVCFGSLAQRNAESRNCVYRFLAAARRTVRLFDVNLRQDYFDQHIIEQSCGLASILKLNEEELHIVSDLLNLGHGGESPAWFDQKATRLLARFDLRMVVLTRGPRGMVLYTPNERQEAEPVHYPPATNADHVGAGDACSAALLVGLVKRWPIQTTLALANHLGAFVASQPGGTPALPESILNMVKS